MKKRMLILTFLDFLYLSFACFSLHIVFYEIEWVKSFRYKKCHKYAAQISAWLINMRHRTFLLAEYHKKCFDQLCVPKPVSASVVWSYPTVCL